MTATSKDFFSSPEGLATVASFYGGLTQPQVERHMALVDKAVGQLPADTGKIRILDAGCGDGNQDHVLSLRFNAAVVGVTPFDGEHQACLDKKAQSALTATDPYRDVEFRQDGMPDFANVEGPFNVIYSDAVFQYAKGDDRQATYRRFHDLLATGGTVALRSPDRPTFSTDSCHPSPDGFRAEVAAFNSAAKGEFRIVSLETTPDTLAEKRPEKGIAMIELVLQKA